jgi:hypothetical protein
MPTSACAVAAQRALAAWSGRCRPGAAGCPPGSSLVALVGMAWDGGTTVIQAMYHASSGRSPLVTRDLRCWRVAAEEAPESIPTLAGGSPTGSLPGQTH